MNTRSTPLSFASITYALAFALLSTTCFSKEDPTEAPPKKRNWETIEYEGRSYVSATNISKFYQFQRFKQDPETQSATFYHPNLKLELNSSRDHKEIQVNKIRFALFRKTIWDEENERLLFSTLDLTFILDPTVRPSYIRKKEDDRPYYFTLDGDEMLAEKFDLDLLIEEVESRGLTAVKKRDDVEVIHIALNLELEEDATKSDQISTQWFWEPKSNEAINENTLSIALATSLHSHISHKKGLKGNLVAPRKIEDRNQSSPRAKLVFTFSESFDSFKGIHTGIADAILKSRKAIASRR